VNEPNDKGRKSRSLRDALRRVRLAEAERSDVVVDLHDAERVRLEMLAEELNGVFAEVPKDNDTFLFSVAGGSPQRLWIDMTSFVVMGRDRRTYRFLKDTRLGRTVILETASLDDMADCITHYIAERIIERERTLEGDWLMKRVLLSTAKPEAPAEEGTPAVAPTSRDYRALGWVAAAFLAGILIGFAILLGWAWTRV